MKKSFLAAGGSLSAIVVAAGLMLAPSAALADVADETASTEVVAETTTESEAPEAEVVESQAPVTTVTEGPKVVDDTNMNLDVKAPQPVIADDSEMVGSIQVPETVTPTPQTKQLKWVLPDNGTSSNVTWPQPVFDSAAIQCGVTVTIQVDTYPYTTDADKARTDALDDDGLLTHGEDHGWAQSWYFDTFSAPACEVPSVPAITPATPTFTTAPTCDTDGTYVLPEGPAAQNHNPEAGLHGVELDGYHLYVKNTTGEFGAPGVYTWDAYGIGAKGNAAYPLGTSVGGKVDSNGKPKAGGKVSGTFEVLSATDDCPVVVPPKPDAKTTESTSTSVKCEVTELGVGVHTTIYNSSTETWVYDSESNTWIAGDPIIGKMVAKRFATTLECPPATVPSTEVPTVVVGDDEDQIVAAAQLPTGTHPNTGGAFNPTVPIIIVGIAIFGGLGFLFWGIYSRRNEKIEQQ